MTKTHSELMAFLNVAKEYRLLNPNPSKFLYHLKTVEDAIKDGIKKIGHETIYSKACEDSRYKYASEDKNKNLILTEGGAFTFTKENHRKLVAEIQEHSKILNETIVEFEIPISEPLELNDDQYELLSLLSQSEKRQHQPYNEK